MPAGRSAVSSEPGAGTRSMEPPGVIRVLLADDHGVVRDGLGRLIEALEGVELAGTAANGQEAVEQARALEPDVILMDLESRAWTASRPRGGSSPSARRPPCSCSRRSPTARGSWARWRRVPAAICSRTSPPTRWPKASARPSAASPRSTRGPPALLNARPEPDPLEGLSAREREVLALLVEGMPNKLIARRLEISEKTVKAHLTSGLPRARRDRSDPGCALGRLTRNRRGAAAP